MCETARRTVAMKRGPDGPWVQKRTAATFASSTRETIHLAVLEDMDVIYIHKEAGLHAIGLMSSRVGGRNPAYCTGVGKALLAYAPPELVRSSMSARRLRTSS